MTHEMIHTPIGRLHVVSRAGNPARTPLVLGHGIFLDSGVWDEVLAHPEGPGDRTAVRIDGPGHGWSDPAPPGWSLDEHAGAVLAILDALAIRRAVLAGHSWGGMVALRAALRAPDRAAGVGLVNTPLVRTEGWSRLGFRAQQAVLRTVGPTAFFARRAAAALHDAESLRRRPELVDRTVARMGGRDGGALADVLRAVVLDPPSTLHRLAGLPMPLSVVAGEHDYVFSSQVRAELATVSPRAVLTVARGGHISPEEDPGAVARVLRDVVERADSAGDRQPR